MGDWQILGEELYAQIATSLMKYKMQMNVANNVPTVVYYKNIRTCDQVSGTIQSCTQLCTSYTAL